MPQSFLLQDWTHLEGTSGNAIIQGEEGWLDLSGYTDVVVHLSTKSCGANVVFQYQTSPSKDADLFSDMTAAAPITPGSDARVVTPLRFASLSTPLARWLRWQINDSAGAYEATFRIWVSAVTRG